MINSFWRRHLLDTQNGQNKTVRLPATANVQIGERGIYPHAEEARRQARELGDRWLGHNRVIRRPRQPTTAEIMQAFDDLRVLFMGLKQAEPIAFKARRLPASGADLD